MYILYLRDFYKRRIIKSYLFILYIVLDINFEDILFKVIVNYFAKKYITKLEF